MTAKGRNLTWKRTPKITPLLLLAGMLTLTWGPTGHTQACNIERGEDLLEVLKVGVKHNVFIGLDNSGTMKAAFNGSTAQGPESYAEDRKDTNPNDNCGSSPGDCSARLRIAKDVLTSIINDPDLNDSSGNPLVNWGFFYTAKQDDGVGNLGAMSCAVPQKDNSPVDSVLDSECVGLDSRQTLPPTCGQAETKQIIVDQLRPRGSGGIPNNGGTANAISLNQIAGIIKRNYMGSNQKPGQRNFIIYITDGYEDCACEKRDGSGNPLPISFPAGTAGVPKASVDFKASGKIALRNDDVAPFDPNQSIAVGSNNSYLRGYNQAIMAQHALMTIDPNLDGSQGDIFVMLIGQNNAGTRAVNTHWGWEASGVSLGRSLCPPQGGIGCARPGGFAGHAKSMAAAIKNVLLQVGVPPATVSLGASVVGSVKEVIPTHTNTALSAADLLAMNSQDKQKLQNRSEHRNNVLFTTEVTTPGFQGHLKAFNVYKVQANGTRGADFTQIWDAGEVLRDRTSPRNILFNRPVPSGTQPPPPIDFSPGPVLPTDLGVGAGFLKELDPKNIGAKTDADAVELVVKVIHGWRLIISPANGFYKSDGKTLNLVDTVNGQPTWKLFEASGSTPAVVLNPPRSPDADPPQPSADYKTFYDTYINRQTVVYLGTNGGMLHAFRSDNGHEIYAYIPADLLPKLKDLVKNVVANTNGTLSHQFFVAASPVVEDAFLQPSPRGVSEWRTVLSVGRGQGGKFLSALDITEVGDWTGTSSQAVPPGFQPPRLLFTVGNRDGVPDDDTVSGLDYDGLGETWSIPVMGRVQSQSVEGQWVVFAGSGYGCTGTEEGKYLYVLKLEDGSIIRKLGPIKDVPGAAIDENALVATPALYNPHEPGSSDGKDFVHRVYLGDLQGIFYKLDCTNKDPAQWQFDVFFEVTQNADQGSGQGAYNQPITSQAAILKLAGSDQILIFFGTGGDSRVRLVEPERFKLVGLVDLDSAGPGNLGELISTASGDKFFYSLPPEERVSVAPVTARNAATNGVVFFASSRVKDDPATCSRQFFSTLFAAGATTGLGTFDLDPSSGGTDSQADLGSGKVTGLFHRDGHLYVSKSGGIGVASETQIRGNDDFPVPSGSGAALQVHVENFRMSPF
jgi:hypothetical protein